MFRQVTKFDVAYPSDSIIFFYYVLKLEKHNKEFSCHFHTTENRGRPYKENRTMDCINTKAGPRWQCQVGTWCH